MVGLFLCYPLLPVAFYCGFGMLDGRLYGLCAPLYYLLLLSSLWGCRRFGGWVAGWYTLAFAVTWLHIFGVAGTLLNLRWEAPLAIREWLFGCTLMTVPGVFLCNCCAGAAMAFRQKRPMEALLQMGAPFLMLTFPLVGSVSFLVSFAAQGLHALMLANRMTREFCSEDLNGIGFSPES